MVISQVNPARLDLIAMSILVISLVIYILQVDRNQKMIYIWFHDRGLWRKLSDTFVISLKYRLGFLEWMYPSWRKRIFQNLKILKRNWRETNLAFKDKSPRCIRHLRCKIFVRIVHSCWYRRILQGCAKKTHQRLCWCDDLL